MIRGALAAAIMTMLRCLPKGTEIRFYWADSAPHVSVTHDGCPARGYRLGSHAEPMESPPKDGDLAECTIADSTPLHKGPLDVHHIRRCP